MAAPGRVVILNGTSSAGKTTLAINVQALFEAAGECWIWVGVDDLFMRLPRAWLRYGGHVGVHAVDGIEFEPIDGVVERRIGPIGTALLATYRQLVASAARNGLNVLVDEVLLSEADHAGWLDELDGIDVMWVKVDPGLDVLVERERARGDRLIGMARGQHDVVHVHPRYDLEVDTGVLDAPSAARAVYDAVRRER